VLPVRPGTVSVTERGMRILQVNTSDGAGGAQKVALNLLRAYRLRGHSAWLAVGEKFSKEPGVILMPEGNRGRWWTDRWLALWRSLSGSGGKTRGAEKLRSWVRLVAQPRALLEARLGHEDFEFPGTWQLLNCGSDWPDVLHCHNLHGGYFDLRALPWLSQSVPTILTMHDAWLLSGHCAHSFNCDRWRIGCGDCPDLSIYPSVRRDATAYNWRRKCDLYSRGRVYVATPSRWLMSKVKESMLAPHVVDTRVLPNGVDLTVFHPGEQLAARKALGMSADAKVLLYVGDATRSNVWRDYRLLAEAVRQVGERLSRERITLVCLGEARRKEWVGDVEVMFVGYRTDHAAVATFYQAADVYVHPAKADTFPTAVLEALACGTPVVATSVGGIPEQVADGFNGFLVHPGSAEEMAEAIRVLLTDVGTRARLARNAALDAEERFDLNGQAREYLAWYREIIDKESGETRGMWKRQV
jgi:glycosyltransferase involved in cell wall biosynthesis